MVNPGAQTIFQPVLAHLKVPERVSRHIGSETCHHKNHQAASRNAQEQNSADALRGLNIVESQWHKLPFNQVKGAR